MRGVWLQKNDPAPKRVPAARLVITWKDRVEKSVAVIPQATEADVTDALLDDPTVSAIKIQRGWGEEIR